MTVSLPGLLYVPVLSAEVQKAINVKAGEIVSIREAWTQAASQAAHSGMDDESLVEVVRVFHSPGSLRKLAHSIAKLEDSEEQRFLDAVDKCASESDFVVTEWLQALERILQFLIRSNRSSPIHTLLGYLSCSAEYVSASTGGLGFADSVEAFLEEFGFDG